MSIYLIGFIIPIASFILQSYPRLFNKLFGVDVWTRLLEIEHVKKAHHRIPGKITHGFIIDGYFDYPIVFPFLFSFFSKKRLLSIQGFVSPFFDIIQNFIVFVITLFITQEVAFAITAQIVYALTPILPVENSYMTPRSLGYLNFTLAFFPLFIYYTNPNPLLLITGLIFTTTLFLTHRFALQSFIFISLFFTIYDRTFLYLASLSIGFIAAVVLTKGYYLRVAQGHLSNIYFWIMNYNYRFAHQIYGNKKNEKQDWVGKIYTLMSIFSPIMLFALNIWAFSGILYLLIISQKIVNIPVNLIFTRMAAWVIFFYILGATILKVKRLIPIGEGQRYLEMATVPSAILTTLIFFAFFKTYGNIVIVIFTMLLLANLFLILFVQIKGIVKDKNRSLTNDLQQAFLFINKLPGNPRIMCIPHQITTMTIYNTKASVLVNADNSGLMKVTDFYPILKKPIKKLQKEFNLTHVLLRESFLKKQAVKLTKEKEVFKSGDVIVLKLD